MAPASRFATSDPTQKLDGNVHASWLNSSNRVLLPGLDETRSPSATISKEARGGNIVQMLLSS